MSPIPKRKTENSSTIILVPWSERKLTMFYRSGTSDERVIEEVITGRCYRKRKIGFDVEKGEKWLDLGGNIGSFAAYCYLRGAEVESYEPDNNCFQLLRKNSKGLKNNVAVTHLKVPSVEFYKGTKDTDHYRGTIFPGRTRHPQNTVPNLFAGIVFKEKFDGVKMDIEGTELHLIDKNLIPKCDKLVMEYHLSKDNDMENFHRRMETLRSHFSVVDYIPSLDKGYPDNRYPGLYDRFVFCMK